MAPQLRPKRKGEIVMGNWYSMESIPPDGTMVLAKDASGVVRWWCYGANVAFGFEPVAWVPFREYSYEARRQA